MLRSGVWFRPRRSVVLVGPDILYFRSLILFLSIRTYINYVVVGLTTIQYIPLFFAREQSMDHRGTPESPGLVATLISDSDLEVSKKFVFYVGETSSCTP